MKTSYIIQNSPINFKKNIENKTDYVKTVLPCNNKYSTNHYWNQNNNGYKILSKTTQPSNTNFKPKLVKPHYCKAKSNDKNVYKTTNNSIWCCGLKPKKLKNNHVSIYKSNKDDLKEKRNNSDCIQYIDDDVNSQNNLTLKSRMCEQTNKNTEAFKLKDTKDLNIKVSEDANNAINTPQPSLSSSLVSLNNSHSKHKIADVKDVNDEFNHGHQQSQGYGQSQIIYGDIDIQSLRQNVELERMQSIERMRQMDRSIELERAREIEQMRNMEMLSAIKGVGQTSLPLEFIMMLMGTGLNGCKGGVNSCCRNSSNTGDGNVLNALGTMGAMKAVQNMNGMKPRGFVHNQGALFGNPISLAPNIIQM